MEETLNSTLNSLTFLLNSDCLLRSLPPQDPLFHIANGLFVISYLSPNSRYGRLLLHSGLIIGFLVYSTWAWNVICAPDVFAWYFGFVLVNFGQLMYILYQMRPIRFPDHIENIYLKLFQPMRVTRVQLKRLIAPDIAQIIELHTGECYAVQNLTKTIRLSILVSGRVSVVNDRQFLHHIHPCEFLDSPEYESSGINCEETFKVSVIAAEPSTYLCWQRSSLEYLFIKDPYLGSVMSALISQDITNKLYAMNRRLKNVDIRLPGIVGKLSDLSSRHIHKIQAIKRQNLDKNNSKQKGFNLKKTTFSTTANNNKKL